nr:hypothetical protein [Serratia odorifera]
MNNKAGKVVFADQLRVLAFISVVITHWVGRFWEAQPVVAYLTKSPEIIGITPHYIDRLMPPVPWFDYGSFGVAVFFLISGFVIPFSLKKQKASPIYNGTGSKNIPNLYICVIDYDVIYIYDLTLLLGSRA